MPVPVPAAGHEVANASPLVVTEVVGRALAVDPGHASAIMAEGGDVGFERCLGN